MLQLLSWLWAPSAVPSGATARSHLPKGCGHRAAGNTWAARRLLSLVRENASREWELNLSTTSPDLLLAGSCPDPYLLGRGMERQGSPNTWRRFLTCGLTAELHVLGHRSRSEAWPWKGAGTPWAGCRPPKGCQPSDDTMLGVLKSPHSEVFCIVRALIPSLVFPLFSAEFVFAHKSLNQHSVEPGKSRELEHLIRKRHF